MVEKIGAAENKLNSIWNPYPNPAENRKLPIDDEMVKKIVAAPFFATQGRRCL